MHAAGRAAKLRLRLLISLSLHQLPLFVIRGLRRDSRPPLSAARSASACRLFRRSWNHVHSVNHLLSLPSTGSDRPVHTIQPVAPAHQSLPLSSCLCKFAHHLRCSATGQLATVQSPRYQASCSPCTTFFRSPGLARLLSLSVISQLSRSLSLSPSRGPYLFFTVSHNHLHRHLLCFHPRTAQTASSNCIRQFF